MPDLPIIFSAPMVRALLDGRKSMTRRVLKLQPGEMDNVFRDGGGHWHVTDSRGAWMSEIRLPYAPGDRLYVREAFWLCEQCGYRNMCADGVNYSGFPDRGCCSNCDELLPRAKTSPIHMPRWASRLTLTVTDVRVQRLQEISEADAVAEGVIPIVEPDDLKWEHYAPHGVAFRDLWNSLHGPQAWDANPWIAAYSFTVQRGNIDQIGGAV